MIALVAMLALSQTPQHRLFQQPNLSRSSAAATPVSYAYFEFAPADGAGLDGGVCACTAVSGATGQSLTFTRASSAVCLKKGYVSTGIATGDAVLCATNQPRIGYNDAGVLALFTEASDVNYVFASDDVANASYWTPLNGGGAALPVVTSGYAAGPDGVAGSASRLQVPSCSGGGGLSAVYQNFTGPASGNMAAGYFMMGTGVTDAGLAGSLGFWVNNYGTSVGLAGMSCSYTAGSWTWCGGPGGPQLVINMGGDNRDQVGIGCVNSGVPGVGDTGAADVLIWGVNQQAGTYVTSPIPTTTAAVTRARDVPRFTVSPAPFGATADAGGCVAATTRCLNTSSGRLVTYTGVGGTYEWDVNYGASNASTQWFIGSSTQFNSSLPRTTAAARWVTKVAGSGNVFSICKDGTCQDGGTRGANSSGVTSAHLDLGNCSSTGFTCDGLISQVQVDPDYTRCQ